jgi:hypothetical protein
MAKRFRFQSKTPSLTPPTNRTLVVPQNGDTTFGSDLSAVASGNLVTVTVPPGSPPLKYVRFS